MSPPRRQRPTTGPGVTVRPVEPEADAARLAQLMREYGFPRVTDDGLRDHLAPKPTQTRLTLVALDGTAAGTAPIGYADIFHQAPAPAGKFQLFLLVDPAHRRRGTGARLYDGALAFASSHGLRELRVPAWDDDPDSRAFAARRAFQLEHVITTSVLDLTTFDDAPFASTVDDVRAAGVRLFPLSDVPDTPEHRRRLHHLYRETWLDAPDGAPWVERMADDFTAPFFRPDAAPGFFLAADPTTGEWIGFTTLNVGQDPRYAHQGMTGVRRPYRGRRIALALKLLSIQHARTRGVLEIRTGNDSRNAPILAINHKLGFIPGRGQCSLVKRFPHRPGRTSAGCSAIARRRAPSAG